MKKIEVRFSSNPEFRFAEVDGKNTLVGYAARFDSEAILRHPVHGEFTERIAPGAFKNVLNQDVRALLNHDPNFVFGRTKSGTLRLSEDGAGLRTENDMPDTQAARDLKVSVERGDISQQSFGFVIAKDGDVWEKDESGAISRTITNVAELRDTSYVTFPAYENTEVALRSLEEFRKQSADPDPTVGDPNNPDKSNPMVDLTAQRARGRSIELKTKKLIIEKE